jgi:predicted O-methyltransferase YrrM
MLWAHMIEPDGKVYTTDINFTDKVKYYKNTPYEKYIVEIMGDTHDPNFIESVKNEVGLVDLLFIDGDHSYEGVKKDFYTYFPLLKQGGCVMFHDITDSPVHRERKVFVEQFWKEIKPQFPQALEFIDGNEYSGAPNLTMGIGVIRKDITGL